MKEFFRSAINFLQNISRRIQRQEAQAKKRHRHIHPEIPQRSKEGAAHAEIKHRPQKGTQQQIDAQFPAGGAQGVGDDPYGHQGAEQQIAHNEQRRDAAAHRPQKVVGQSQRGAQQSGAAKEQQLLGNIGFHTPHPKRREKNPPLSRRSSS